MSAASNPRPAKVVCAVLAAALFLAAAASPTTAPAADFTVTVRQITSGPANHFFGYIGRIREYRYGDTPVGNSGVTQNGGHPEWDTGRRLIGRVGDRQVIYDVEEQRVVGQLGSPAIFPNPEGDIALSPDAQWFVNGYKDKQQRKNYYVIYRRRDGAHVRTPGFDIGPWTSGDLRLDPAPSFNRDGTQILVPGLAEPDGSRQLFVLQIHIGS